MTRLNELLSSLAAVIVRYHDRQPKVKKLVVATDAELLREKSFSCAQLIIQNKDAHFRLNELIKQCADSGRSPFLDYILHEIISLKALLNQSSPLEPNQLEEYKNQITQLFINLKLLLKTPKHKACRINPSKTEDAKETAIALCGLKNDAFVGGDLCNSGEILSDELFRRFDVNTATSNERIKDIAEQICVEHQNALSVPELQAQNAVSKKINLEQQQKLDSLSTQHQGKKLETTSVKQHIALYMFYILFKRMQAKEEQQKTVIEQQQETIDELRQKISELTHPVDSKPPNYRFHSPSY